MGQDSNHNSDYNLLTKEPLTFYDIYVNDSCINVRFGVLIEIFLLDQVINNPKPMDKMWGCSICLMASMSQCTYHIRVCL